MSAIVVDTFLGLAVVFAWIGAAGFARLASSLDRLHAVAFVTVGSGLSLVIAAMTFAFDQPSFVDLALCLTLLSVPGTLLYTMFMERFL